MGVAKESYRLSENHQIVPTSSRTQHQEMTISGILGQNFKESEPLI